MSLKKIAGMAEVSVSTVSLVLSGKGRISEAVREKVLDAARKLNYKSPLYSNENKLVAVLYPIDREWRHVLEFIGDIVAGMNDGFIGEGYTPVLLPISFVESIEVIESKIKELSPKAVCSIHFCNAALFSALEKRGVPVVVINRNQLQDRFCTVCVDDFQGAYEGGRYLLERSGGGRVVFVGYAKSNMTNLIDDRVYGFQKALLEAGCSNLADALFYVEEPLMSGLDNIIASLLESSPDAIYVYDDYLAMHLISALEKAGVSVYDQVMILAPGDTLDYNLPVVPGISTMSIDCNKLGCAGAEIALERIGMEGNGLIVRKIRQNLSIRKTTW